MTSGTNYQQTLSRTVGKKATVLGNAEVAFASVEAHLTDEKNALEVTLSDVMPSVVNRMRI